jgi:RimJ/RimL family protein N-acetyltransferase/GNAT superfamily N-acetyltransferase
MHIERFDAGTDRDCVSACHEMHVAAMPVDVPGEPPMSGRVFAGWMRMHWTGDRPENWLARNAAGAPCGWYSLVLPTRENTHLAYLDPLVGLPHRRHGIGTALVRHAAGRAHEEGRATLVADATLGSPGEGFSRALGARAGMPEASRVLHVRAIADGHLARLRARAQAATHGYSLLSWQGPAAERDTGQVAALHQDGEDAPLEDGHERKHWDAARVRATEQLAADQGVRHYSVAARSDRTGELVALTELEVDPQMPEWGYQGLTVVTRAHRGHRLGLLVKVAMLELLAGREPGLERIVTGNADVNEHMIAINTELGYQVLDHWLSWELAVADVLALPAAQS